MSKSLPKEKKPTVYIYRSAGHWMIQYKEGTNPDFLYSTPNEALEAAREIFKLKDQDPEIIICNQNIDSIRLTA